MDDERERVHGEVMNWDVSGKGYGFLHPDQHNESRDVFYSCDRSLAPGVHNLTPGERVTFIMTRGDRGLTASNIRPEPSAHRQIEPPVDRTQKGNQRYDGN